MPTRIHIVLGEIHRDLCEEMLEHAKAAALELDAHVHDVTWVPGSLEVPFAVREILETRLVDAFVILGVIEQGKTKHGEVIGHQVTHQLLQLQLQYRIPMAVAIIGPGASIEHARRKAKATAQKAMRAAVQMATLKVRLAQKGKD